MKSNHDESLINFLKQHEPLPPPAPADAEESLMALIADQAPISQPRSRKKSKVVWLIPTAIAAGMTITWGRYQSYLLSPGIADYDLVPPVITAIQPDINPEENLEAYLESTWSEPLMESESSDSYFGYSELMYSP
ncbi:hypothetical protein Lepto7376_4022 [[Leptolyngbya] sp. PCC 7376]|uniref:hypothetical protein n=1 Tax=[Leptolyngbya] sp. PCC 7376 TaxID=111781 RepID=UPI00029ED8C9|nr:hypothetical protein [[Leptolyngbya] sp. PCC 7376]AFY40159.1 hypothetical protein Lepto7376_4022 [[Leptolyngbya] sp. PCC 7376]